MVRLNSIKDEWKKEPEELSCIFLKGSSRSLYLMLLMRMFTKPGWQLQSPREVLVRAGATPPPAPSNQNLPAVNDCKVFHVIQLTGPIWEQPAC